MPKAVAKTSVKVIKVPKNAKTVTEVVSVVDVPEYRLVREKTFFSWLFSMSGDISIRRDTLFFPLGGVRLKRFRTDVGNKYGLHLILWSIELGLKVWKTK